MTDSFERAANATVQVVRGKSFGSGFHLFRNDLVVTNKHVLDAGTGSTLVSAEDLTTSKAEVILQSDDEDFVVLQLEESLGNNRTALKPSRKMPIRGAEVLFAGFPHGISDLLVNDARVTGPFEEDFGFFINGLINGGNSGGPVVLRESGLAVGIITERRFLQSAEIDRLAKEAAVLSSQLSQPRAVIRIGGIDPMQVLGGVGNALDLLARALSANANTGIGIAYSIEWVANACREEGIVT